MDADEDIADILLIRIIGKNVFYAKDRDMMPNFGEYEIENLIKSTVRKKRTGHYHI